MVASENLMMQLKVFEGLLLKATRDVGGVLTIGYGHTGKDVQEGDKITEWYAEELLKQDLSIVESQVRGLKVARTQGQFDALVSFAFNLGIGNLKKSTLLKVIRSGGSRNQIKAEFKRWVYAAGKKMRGLEKRREWEARRFFE